MTSPHRDLRDLRRELERELRETPAPPPPSDLLSKIQAEIPTDLRAANGDEADPHRSGEGRGARRFLSTPGFRLAASVAIAVIGIALAVRTFQRAPQVTPPPASSPQAEETRRKGARLETAPVELEGAIEQKQDEGLPWKGKTKDVGSEVASAAAAAPALPARESPAEARDREAQATRVPNERLAFEANGAEGAASAVPQSPTVEVSPRARTPESSESSEHLAALGYLGGVAGDTLAGAAPVVEAERSAAAPAPAAAAPARVREEQASAKKSSSSDPWSHLQKTPGTLTDRVQVGGKEAAAQGRRVDTAESAGSADSAESDDSSARQSQDFDRFEEIPQPTDMYFRATDTNPFVATSQDRLSTFALDVDTGSWNLTRSYLERGLLPPPEAIRVEEFVNAQRYDDPAPRRGDFALVAEGAPSPFAPDERYRLLRFAVKAREIDAGDRKSANLTFVVDVSGSMSQENRLGLVKRALGLLLDELRGDDRVALVVYGTRGRVLLRHTRDHEAIREAIASLRPEGSTNAEEGLRLGYDLADEAWRKESINRIVLCSDGVANVGATGPESILARIGGEARRGIELTTVGFGMGNYNDALMEQLADQGDGSYHYVDTLEEARRIFVENLTGTLQTVARDAKVQVAFNPSVVDRWRLVGYENRAVADRDFRNDAVDAGELGVGHEAVALYEVRLRDDARGTDPVGTMRLRWKSRATKHVEEASLALAVADLDDTFRRASSNLRTAAVAAELAERLRLSRFTRDGSWSELLQAADRLAAERGGSGRQLHDTVHRVASLVDRGDPLPDDEERRPNRERLEDD